MHKESIVEQLSSRANGIASGNSNMDRMLWCANLVILYFTV